MSDPTRPRLKVSREGIVLIKSFEGFRPRAVRGDDGRWVIGYGHTASAREGLTVGEPDAELLLQYDLMPVVKALNERIVVPLNQHQFDALASFALSVGVDRFLSSDVFDQLSAGRAGQAADALIGWPETTGPEAALRRRAAERALFVADPAGPVALADLLAAPLPPPPMSGSTEPTPDAVAQARAAAVASLLGEPVVPPPAEAATTIAPAAEPAVEAADGAQTSPEPPAAAATPAAPVMAHLQRYSPYATALIGPLPGFPTATPVVAPEPAPESLTEPQAEPAAAPVAEAPSAAEAETATLEDAARESEPAAPDFSPAPSFEAAPFTPSVTTIAFPNLIEPLVLTPATEADFAEGARPVWPAEQRAAPPAEDSPLFEAEPPLSVLRHEVEPVEPRRFDWSETGMYLLIGGIGLTACASSAAAFRLSVTQPSPMGETTVIAWALALIGVLCVGVSSWNLYVRWGKGD